MNDMKQLNQLGPITDEMLAGLKADEAMRLRIVRAAKQQKKQTKTIAVRRFAPALAAAALAVVCIGGVTSRLYEEPEVPAPHVAPLVIDEIAAGPGQTENVRMMADLGDGASVRMSGGAAGSLFAEGSGDIPLVAVDGAVYRMLQTPQDIGRSLLGGQIGTVATHTSEPSLASSDAMRAGLSNVAGESTAIYAIKGLDDSSAVAAEVNGNIRLFQRVSYAGKGPGKASLEDVFAVRGQVKSVELSGVGTLEGSKADEVIAVLLDKATLVSADASARRQYLTVTLDSGLRLQMGVSGDMLCGCGGWSCPEFFAAFEKAL